MQFPTVLLTGMIEGDPGIIVGPVASFIGFIINFIFNGVNFLTVANSLGIAIIILTIIVRTGMLPIAFRQQRSSAGMAKIAPEVNKIKEKYAGNKDPEVQKKMNMEIQELYRTNNVNLLGGCLPMLITLPIFYALTYVMRQPFLFIPDIGDIYREIAELIYTIPNWVDVVRPIIVDSQMVPSNMQIDIAVIEDFIRCIHLFSPEHWATIGAAATPEVAATLETLVATKDSIATFAGINLIAMPTMAFPSILIPILSGGTQFFTFFIMQRLNPSAAGAGKTQQMVMSIAMPAMMLVFTFQVSAGVGLYWTVSNIYQLVQQVLMNKFYKGKKGTPKNGDIIEDKPKKEIIKLTGKKKPY